MWPGVKKKIFKLIMHFHYTWPIWLCPNTKTPALVVMKFTLLHDAAFPGHYNYIYLVYLLYVQEKRRRFLRLHHFFTVFTQNIRSRGLGDMKFTIYVRRTTTDVRRSTEIPMEIHRERTEMHRGPGISTLAKNVTSKLTTLPRCPRCFYFSHVLRGTRNELVASTFIFLHCIYASVPKLREFYLCCYEKLHYGKDVHKCLVCPLKTVNENFGTCT